ncbi:MAG: MFS transporter [Bryobacteraceae bacterium]|nr:MFS transporter [Bryobacteraceae bacterium]
MLTTRSRWALCILLLLGTTINYLDRQTLSLMAPLMREELGLNNEKLGLLFSFFYYAYTVAQFAAGGLVDRSNLRWAYGGAVLLWSLVGLMTATAGGFWSLAAFRVALGITESPNWPGALKIVSRALPAQERPLGNGIFTSGQSIGALTAPVIVLTIANLWGWRMGFAGVGLLGLVWFALWAWFTRRPEFAPVWPATENASARAGYLEVLREPRFWLVAVITSTVNPILYFNVNWLPTYFNQERGVAAGSPEMKWVLTLIFLGLDLGYLVFGFASLRAPRRLVFGVATLLVAVAAGVPWAAERNTLLALLTVSNFGLGMWMAMYLTFTQEVSSRAVSTAMGLAGGIGSLAGAFLMWVVGMVTERTHSFEGPFVAIAVAIGCAWVAGMAATRRANG